MQQLAGALQQHLKLSLVAGVMKARKIPNPSPGGSNGQMENRRKHLWWQPENAAKDRHGHNCAWLMKGSLLEWLTTFQEHHQFQPACTVITKGLPELCMNVHDSWLERPPFRNDICCSLQTQHCIRIAKNMQLRTSRRYLPGIDLVAASKRHRGRIFLLPLGASTVHAPAVLGNQPGFGHLGTSKAQRGVLPVNWKQKGMHCLGAD
eukprot:1161804-Pelagomonas_calceolata.AAC.5